jgi:hypothetical protein
MEKGSHGRLCAAINAFLVGVTVGLELKDDFVCDDVYGEKSARRMMAYQDMSDLVADGGCGPATRAVMKADGFDIEVVARALGGRTIFVQTDGTEVDWFEIEARFEEAMRRVLAESGEV